MNGSEFDFTREVSGNLNINFDDIKPDLFKEEKKEFKPIPEGDYDLIVDECEIKTSQAGNKYLSTKLKVTTEAHKNRVIFDQFSVYHPKSNVKEIALKRLKSLCEAVGIEGNLNNSSDLVNKSLKAKVIITQDNTNYGPQNKVQYYIKKEKEEFPF